MFDVCSGLVRTLFACCRALVRCLFGTCRVFVWALFGGCECARARVGMLMRLTVGWNAPFCSHLSIQKPARTPKGQTALAESARALADTWEARLAMLLRIPRAVIELLTVREPMYRNRTNCQIEMSHLVRVASRSFNDPIPPCSSPIIAPSSPNPTTLAGHDSQITRTPPTWPWSLSTTGLLDKPAPPAGNSGRTRPPP